MPVANAPPQRSPEILSCNERRLQHDIIELRNEQRKIYSTIEALKRSLERRVSDDIIELRAEQQRVRSAVDAFHSEQQKIRSTFDALRRDFNSTKAAAAASAAAASAGQAKTTSQTTTTETKSASSTALFSASPRAVMARLGLAGASPLTNGAPSTDNLASPLSKRLSSAFEDMENMMHEEVLRMKGELSAKKSPSTARESSVGTPLGGVHVSARAGVQAGGSVSLDSLRGEMRHIQRKLERVNRELPLVGLKTCRIALRAPDLRSEERLTLLEVVEMKEALLLKQAESPQSIMPRSSPPPVSHRSTMSGDSADSTVNEFRKVIMDFGGANPASADDFLSGSRLYDHSGETHI